ncbi:MAG TPA: TetR/AcrR family transcriptional regulator [Cytophagaceae bacterium]|jgi:AcrR family transcriptional regulator
MEGIQTEDHIKQTARKLFFSKGRLDAKTQEIADEAGVNRALLHYYFRTREKLFDVVLKEAMEEAFQQMFKIMTSELEFEKKIEQMVSHIIDRIIEYPYMESFIISEMIKKPESVKMMPRRERSLEVRNRFVKELENFIASNKIPFMSPNHFIVNLMSMCTYPAISKPFLKHIFEMEDEEYQVFLLQRKEVITKVLLGKG